MAETFDDLVERDLFNRTRDRDTQTQILDRVNAYRERMAKVRESMRPK